MELGSLHSGRDVVRLGGQQIENAILGNFDKKFPFQTTAMPCQEDRLVVVSIEKKTDEFNEHSCKIAPTLLSFSLASMCKAKATLYF